MGCNCGGGPNRPTIGANKRQAAFRAAGSPVGFSADTPHLVGEVNDAEPRRVRVLKVIPDLTVGQAAFVTGDGVDDLLLSGAFHDITRTSQKKRLWKVNGFTYTDAQEANRVAASLGVKPVEVA